MVPIYCAKQRFFLSAHFSVLTAAKWGACVRIWVVEYEFLQLLGLHSINNCIYNINLLYNIKNFVPNLSSSMPILVYL